MIDISFDAVLCGVLWICLIHFVFACIGFIDLKGGDMYCLNCLLRWSVRFGHRLAPV